MMTIEGICEQLRRYNQGQGVNNVIQFKGDTSCDLVDTQSGGKIGFGNPYQLMEYLTEHTGVRR